MFVGEQPGDQEDLAGRPFVGPAGQVFDKALAEAGVARDRTYVTNAVKHFKHEVRGKRRLHKTPDRGEVTACRWWLDAERRVVRPRVVVMLGATAALGVIGKPTPIGANRGKALQLPDQSQGVVTYHPSFLLRLPDDVRDMLARGELTAGHARTLITAEDPAALARQIVGGGLSVREAEALSQREAVQPRKRPASPPVEKDADTRAIEKQLSDFLGLAVTINHSPTGGKLAEGAFTAPILVEMARSRQVETPIAEAVADIIAGHIGVAEAVAALLARPIRAER